MAKKTKHRSVLHEKRCAPRIATTNFLGYVCIDEEGEEISDGYGWTVNLSKNGLKMETFRPIETSRVLILAVDLHDQLLEIKGDVVYFHRKENKKYEYGIQFFDTEHKQKEMIKNFVKSYFVRDKKLLKNTLD